MTISSTLDSTAISDELGAAGYAVVPGHLTAAATEQIASVFDDRARFRSTIEMSRHGYGMGTYRYFDHPLPSEIAALRAELYAAVLPIARRWSEQLGLEHRYPDRHAEFLEDCHAAGQCRPTPLILHYTQGGHNRLHQDRYGAIAFPLQAAVMLSPSTEYRGGQFVLVEQRPRQQSRAHVVDLEQGDMIVFPNEHRPTVGRRGHHRVHVRHGVAEVRSGRRRVLGLILHDAT